MLFRQPNVNFESSFAGDNNVVENEMNVDINMMAGGNIGAGGSMPMGGGCSMGHGHHHMHAMEQGQHHMHGGCSEPVKQKCIHKTFVHEVPHDS